MDYDSTELPSISGQLSQAYKRGFDDAADSQAVKERHWRELLDAIGSHMLLLDMESIAEHWREVDYNGNDGGGVYGTTYAELYKRLGLAGESTNDGSKFGNKKFGS